MRKYLENKKGITLVALVVTIIVLLILAGVSIAMLTGDNGILTRAGESKEASEKGELNDRIRIAYNEWRVSEYTDNSQSLKDILEKEFGAGNVINNGDGNWIIGGIEVTIDEQTGKITIGNKTKTITELLEEGKLHIGDFINYDAGTWTAEEISAIQTGTVGSEVIANGSSALPSIAYQFGGFSAGNSRNGNATPYSTSYQPSSSGWRIFDVSEDSITIISAGCPEDYRNPFMANDAYISEYILTGNINSNATELELPNNYTKRDWSVYVNPSQYAISATSITKRQLDNWFSKYKGYSNADTSTATIYKSVYGTKYESLVNMGAYYWLSEAQTNKNLYCVHPSYENVTVNTNVYTFGVRVTVSLSSNIKINETPSNKTVTSKGIDYTYNVWSIE